MSVELNSIDKVDRSNRLAMLDLNTILYRSEMSRSRVFRMLHMIKCFVHKHEYMYDNLYPVDPIYRKCVHCGDLQEYVVYHGWLNF